MSGIILQNTHGMFVKESKMIFLAEFKLFLTSTVGDLAQVVINKAFKMWSNNKWLLLHQPFKTWKTSYSKNIILFPPRFCLFLIFVSLIFSFFTETTKSKCFQPFLFFDSHQINGCCQGFTCCFYILLCFWLQHCTSMVPSLDLMDKDSVRNQTRFYSTDF